MIGELVFESFIWMDGRVVSVWMLCLWLDCSSRVLSATGRILDGGVMCTGWDCRTRNSTGCDHDRLCTFVGLVVSGQAAAFLQWLLCVCCDGCGQFSLMFVLDGGDVLLSQNVICCAF